MRSTAQFSCVAVVALALGGCATAGVGTADDGTTVTDAAPTVDAAKRHDAAMMPPPPPPDDDAAPPPQDDAASPPPPADAGPEDAAPPPPQDAAPPPPPPPMDSGSPTSGICMPANAAQAIVYGAEYASAKNSGNYLTCDFMTGAGCVVGQCCSVGFPSICIMQ